MKTKIYFLISICLIIFLGIIIMPKNNMDMYDYLALENEGISDHTIKFDISIPTIEIDGKFSSSSFIYPKYKANSGIARVYACITTSPMSPSDPCTGRKFEIEVEKTTEYYKGTNSYSSSCGNNYYLYTYAISKAGNKSDWEQIGNRVSSGSCSSSYYDYTPTPSKPKSSCGCSCSYTESCFKSEVNALGSTWKNDDAHTQARTELLNKASNAGLKFTDKGDHVVFSDKTCSSNGC